MARPVPADFSRKITEVRIAEQGFRLARSAVPEADCFERLVSRGTLPVKLAAMRVMPARTSRFERDLGDSAMGGQLRLQQD